MWCHRLLFVVALVLVAIAMATSSVLAAVVANKRSVRSAAALDALLTEFLESGDTKGGNHGDNDDYDLHYDQRQTGSENYRVNVDGVMVAVPAASETTISSLGALATNYLMDLAAATGELDGDEDDEEADEEAGGVDVVEELIEEEQQQQQGLPVEIEHSITAEAAPYKYAENSRRLSAAGIQSASASLNKRPTIRPAAEQPQNKKQTKKTAFVQESRSQPRNGPAKKRNKYVHS